MLQTNAPESAQSAWPPPGIPPQPSLLQTEFLLDSCECLRRDTPHRQTDVDHLGLQPTVRELLALCGLEVALELTFDFSVGAQFPKRSVPSNNAMLFVGVLNPPVPTCIPIPFASQEVNTGLVPSYRGIHQTPDELT